MSDLVKRLRDRNGGAFEALREEAADEIERLRKAIEDYLMGDYPNPRDYRPNDCPHGTLYWVECTQCNEDHFTKALSTPPKETLEP